jgi:uncharacterized protein DUF4258
VTGSIVLSEHARWQARRRGLDEATILTVARSPEQVFPVRPGREIRQSRVTLPPEGREYLVRVVIDSAPGEETVVTVYRTSKIEKYWR